MRKIFIILFLMLSIFTVINAHPFKTEKELQDFYAKIDKEVDKELKKDYIKLFEQRKANLKEKASNNDTKKMLEDNEYLFVFENGKLEKVFKKDILDGKFIILSYMYENGKKEKIVCLNKENSVLLKVLEKMEFLYIVDSSMLEKWKEYIKNTMKVVRFLKRLILLMIKKMDKEKFIMKMERF